MCASTMSNLPSSDYTLAPDNMVFLKSFGMKGAKSRLSLIPLSVAQGYHRCQVGSSRVSREVPLDLTTNYDRLCDSNTNMV